MVRPIVGPVTLGYREKMRSRPLYVHRGIDFGARIGTPVYATRSGVVVHASSHGGYGSAYGLHVIVHTGSIWHLYAHLSAESVTVGQAVRTGQQIGRAGASGNATGPHLHYQENTRAPGDYRSDRRPEFITYTDGPVDRMDPANYGPGAHGEHVTWYGSRLVRHGFGEDYTPTADWGPADERKTAEFQRAQGWTGPAADGLPGRETLKRLAAKPGRR